MSPLTTFAPAKINWTLEVLGKRDDGYHEIRSVMQTIELHDRLIFSDAERTEVEYANQDVPDNDLVARAATLVPEATASIRVAKDIPEGVGLGGGSSDAAGTLRGLRQFAGGVTNDADLAVIGAGLGSDVPFFAYGGTALVEGRGERVTPLTDVTPTWIVLLVPPIRIVDKTRTMYAALRPEDFSDGSRTAAFSAHIEQGGAVEDKFLRNAFERAAYEVFDGLEKYRDWLLAAGASSVHLCGAGPVLFAPTSGESEARAMRARLTRPKTGERTWAVRTIGRAEATAVWDS